MIPLQILWTRNDSGNVQCLVLSKGFGNPAGMQVRVWRVGVRVWNGWPHINPYPWAWVRVYPYCNRQVSLCQFSDKAFDNKQCNINPIIVFNDSTNAPHIPLRHGHHYSPISHPTSLTDNPTPPSSLPLWISFTEYPSNELSKNISKYIEGDIQSMLAHTSGRSRRQLHLWNIPVPHSNESKHIVCTLPFSLMPDI